MFSSSQIFEKQMIVIFKKFQYSQIFNKPKHEKKAVYNQFLIRLEGAVRREMKSLAIFIDFLQKDKKTFRNVNVFALIRNLFFHVYSAYQTHRICYGRPQGYLKVLV